MIDGLKPYPEYEESGLTWLDRLPIGWKILRGKSVFYVLDIRSESGDEEILTVSASDGVIPRSQKTVTMFMAKSYIGHKLCWPGDLVVNSLWAWMQGLGFSKYHGLISSAYSVYRPRKDFAEYLEFFQYLLRSAAYKWELQTRSKGVWLSRLQLSDMAFMDMPILIPPKDVAFDIVKFLNYATRKLNRAIRAKQKVIALLNEQKQVIIHRAVTRGLDPNVPLKPSGIPWLGDIPRHWDLRPLKGVLRRMDYGTSQNLGREGKVRVLTMGNIQDGEIILPEHGSLDEVPMGLCLEENDLLFNRTNSPELVGKVGLFMGSVEDNITFASYLVRLRTHDEHSPLWLNYLLNSVRFWAYTRSHALLSLHQANLNSTRYGQMILPIPPKSEQDQISKHISQQVDGIHHVIASKKKQITLLQEFRTRLIADVVTGKLDVREAARRIPDETETDELAVENGEYSIGYNDVDVPCLTAMKESDEIDSNPLKYGAGANR